MPITGSKKKKTKLSDDEEELETGEDFKFRVG
jgi:hypothetical protein